MATWGYIRVSSKDQNEERQVNELLPLVDTISHLIIEKQSGKDFQRDKYISLKNIMRKNDTLIIKSIDRLGRNYEDLKNEWKYLSNKGIKIKVIDTPILDSDNYDNELMGNFINNIIIEILSFVAENERKDIRKRQAEGIKIAKENGVSFGRPTIPYPVNFESIYNQWKNKEISGVEAMKILKLKKSSFYKLIKRYENK